MSESVRFEDAEQVCQTPLSYATRAIIGLAGLQTGPARQAESPVATGLEDTAEPLDIDTEAPALDSEGMYLADIGKIPLLTAVEEVELGKSIEAGLLAGTVLELEKAKASADSYTAVRERLRRSLEPYFAALVMPANKTPEAVEATAETVRTQAEAAVEELECLVSNTGYSLAELRALQTEGAHAKERLIVSNLRLAVYMAKRFKGRGLSFQELIQESNAGLIRAVEKFDYTKGYKFSTYATWWMRQSITRAIADQGRTVRLPIHYHEEIAKMKRISYRMASQLGRQPEDAEVAAALGISLQQLKKMRYDGRSIASLDQPVRHQESYGSGMDMKLGDTLAAPNSEAAENHILKVTLAKELRAIVGMLPEQEALIIDRRFGLTDGVPRTLAEVAAETSSTRQRVSKVEQAAKNRLLHLAHERELRALLE